MRIGLLADIHGNAHALISVLKSAKEKKIKNYYSFAASSSAGPSIFELVII